jgi:hypothetical protein
MIPEMGACVHQSWLRTHESASATRPTSSLVPAVKRMIRTFGTAAFETHLGSRVEQACDMP